MVAVVPISNASVIPYPSIVVGVEVKSENATEVKYSGSAEGTQDGVKSASPGCNAESAVAPCSAVAYSLESVAAAVPNVGVLAISAL